MDRAVAIQNEQRNDLVASENALRSNIPIDQGWITQYKQMLKQDQSQILDLQNVVNQLTANPSQSVSMAGQTQVYNSQNLAGLQAQIAHLQAQAEGFQNGITQTQNDIAEASQELANLSKALDALADAVQQAGQRYKQALHALSDCEAAHPANP
jgi:chromosome segregation ATPase